MRILIYLLFMVVSIVLSLVLTWIGPWWLMILSPWLCAFIFRINIWEAMLLGFFSALAFWGFMILLAYPAFDSPLFERIAWLLPLEGSVISLVALTLLIAGLLGSLAGLSGYYWKKGMGIVKAKSASAKTT